MPTKTILLAEDDEALNRMVSRMLESSGFLVLSAKDGEEALTLFEANCSDIALVISDIEMPKMSGIKLRSLLKQQNPNIKIIMMSATVPEYEIQDSPSSAIDKYIAKPFEIFSFLSLVEAYIAI